MTIHEADWRMRSAPEADVERFTEGRAMSERIHEWLATPEGTVANNPSWGHGLARLKHEPIDVNLEVQIEMLLARKMVIDIDNLRLISIGVEARAIDLVFVTVTHQYGTEQQQVTL